ncbi:MAG: L-aspartate oxidase [Bacteroidetes bacterium]|nr:L-aspartate oxidase [Bacteroidota bacterium]MCW5897008.1 L-aspartate oxidase [Bacteroidota bacterium]
MTHRFDFLVLGSGIAGLSYALKVAEYGTVGIITKKEKAESNTNYAQGGVAAVMSQLDSFDMHIHDTLSAGGGLCHSEAVEILVREGPERLRELTQIGVEFTRNQTGGLDLGREGGHSVNRIVHSHDLTGREIERALVARVTSHPDIHVFENHIAIDLLTEHHAATKHVIDGTNIHCWGAYALNVYENVVQTFLAKAVLLATGGLGHVYLHTTNPLIATGDGVAMAYRAGATIANMEFVQFHPTSLYDSGSPSFLISEAVRGFGGILKTQDGEEFMQKYDDRKSLAPRDIVAYAIDTELKRRGDDFVILDLRHLPADDIIRHFPHIYQTCLEKYKLDITREPIPVVPAAHYACGGVLTDTNGRTSIHGLYASGEVSMTGVHGANRLASNSLLEGLVFSDRAARHAREFLARKHAAIPEIRDWDDSGTLNSEEWVLISHNRREIQQIMWDYVGIVRSNLRLERALRRMDLIRNEVETFYKKTKVTEGLIELRNLALCAMLVITCAMKRRESRGLHLTTDYRGRNDKEFLADTIVD